MRSLLRMAGVILWLAMSHANADLPPCPETPNCVSSLAQDSGHYIDALAYTGSAESALDRLHEIIKAQPRTRITAISESHLQAEIRSLLFRFIDDIEFRLDADKRVIQVRSASRVGYSDFGVNRRRVERIRRAFNAADQE